MSEESAEYSPLTDDMNAEKRASSSLVSGFTAGLLVLVSLGRGINTSFSAATPLSVSTASASTLWYFSPLSAGINPSAKLSTCPARARQRDFLHSA